MTRRARTLARTFGYAPPFDWPALLAFFGRRAIAGVERVAGTTYHRALRTAAGPVVIAVRDAPGRRRLRVESTLDGRAAGADLEGRLRRAFDLDADAVAIDAAVARATGLRADVRARPGLRVPGAWDGFETAVRVVLGQQISVAGATTLAGRIAARFGDPLPARLVGDSGLARLFPGPERLADAALEPLGVIGARAAAIRGLARAVLAEPGLLVSSGALEADLARWQALPGIGPWSAQLIAMRVLGVADALPAGDLGLRKAITPVGRPPRPATDVDALLEPCRPYRAYAAIRLWSLAAASGAGDAAT